MRRAVHGHHPRGEQEHPRQVARRRAEPGRDLLGARLLRDRPGPRQARAVGCGAQPLQAPQPRCQEQRRRARQVQHPAGRPHGLRQDAAGADARPHPRRALHHGRRHHPHRGRLRRRGRGEHHPQAAAERRLQRRAGAARHRLHRRDRQDLAQVRQPLHHARRVGRGRAAGAAQDHGRHGRVRAAAGRTQASPAGVPAGRYLQHPVHLRRRVRWPGEDHLQARPRAPRSASAPRSRAPTSGARATSSRAWSRRTCSSSA